MSVLSGKNILLGVTAGIAAYKTAHLTRLLIKSGAQVRVVMTPKATEFITPLTLSTLSKNPVLIDFVNTESDKEMWNSHVDLGLWADYMLIAPATANTLSKIVKGTADNLLVATYLSAKCPVYIAPAMDLDMYKHPSTKKNLDMLQTYGNTIIPPEIGELASGLTGEGRMAEPENIIYFLELHIKGKLTLYNKKVLITAGPTYESIDPVRFIGNHSSGKMGFELAKRASELGADVVLIAGPTALNVDSYDIKRIDVVSAIDMYNAVFKQFNDSDIVIAAAAVADYRPIESATQKIKKNDENLTLVLTKNPDILANMGEQKKHQFLVGFALETENELSNAQSKLDKKNLDMIVLNSLRDTGAGFKSDTNKVTVIDKKGNVHDLKLQSKRDVAINLFNLIIEKYRE